MKGRARDLEPWLKPLKEAPAEIVAVACPPFPLLAAAAASLAESPCELGAQDCHHEAEGAFTGEVSPRLLAEVGCSWVILGHSERRQAHQETPELIAAKAAAALAEGLRVILCLGEDAKTRARLSPGELAEALSLELKAILPAEAGVRPGALAVAYEPVWAIGTGAAALPPDLPPIFQALRATLADTLRREVAATIPLLYGGSAGAENAAAFLREGTADGLLVGGVSAKPDELARTAEALASAR